MKMKMILLVLGLAMVQDQTLAASKHHLVETKHKHYLVETKNKTQVGRGAENVHLTFLVLDYTVDTFKWFTDHFALFFLHEYLPNLRQIHSSKNIWPISKDSYSINDADEQPADKVTGGGGERPLGEKLPDGFEVKDDEGETYNLTGAIELHRLVLQDYDQLKKRKDEITRKIIESTCAVDDEYDGHYKEVSQPPLPPFLPRSRHCSSLVGSELIKQRPYS